MAYVKFVNEKYEYPDSIENLVTYLFNPNKIVHDYVGGYGLNLKYIPQEMRMVKRFYHKCDRRQVYHLIVSFDKGETEAVLAWYTGWEVVKYFGEKFQAFFVVHEDTNFVHLHVVINTVSYVDGSRLSLSYLTAISRIRKIIDNG